MSGFSGTSGQGNLTDAPTHLSFRHQMFEHPAIGGIRTSAGEIKVLRIRTAPALTTPVVWSIGIGHGLPRVTYATEEESSMADNNKSGPAEAVKGVVEDVKGRAKEAVGAVTGQDDLTREGQAQQDKAEAQRNAAKKEAEAEAARGGAKAAEERQKSNQNQ
jgi:uncharacterized protein YjbJ (UPF0337 family)